ncbi:MAG: LemA family protein [Xenococcaceae cyanobacterium MO_207.B15]|nr:LemA family protein [Xenococcaceae cyanobacterium MO_207.B15]
MKTNLLKKTQRIFLASSLCLAVFLFPLKSEALTVQEVPNPRQLYSGWVTDSAEILTDSTEARLNQMIEQLEAQNGTELAVVTVPETAPAASPKEFTTELFNYWGIGKKEKDNGVLFLISVGDRRVEIETGYGIEGILPDAKVGRIIDTKIKPRFKQGDFDGGTLAGTKALVVALEGEQSLPISEKLPQNLPLHWVLLTGGSILALGIGTAVYMSRRVFIKPIGKSRFSGGNRIFLCANCHQRMQRLNNTDILVSVLIPEDIASEVLDLASRYYAEQEKSYSDSELVEAATEAGIPAQFIEQAIKDVQAQHQQKLEQQKQVIKHRQMLLKISAAFLAAIALWNVWTYNSLSGAALKTEAAWAQVENQLQRRTDLIPNLVTVTQAYAQHEKELISLLVQSRQAYLQAVTPEEKATALVQINQAIGRFRDYAATNPELQSSQLFVNLQYELAGTENRLAVERMRYNRTVQDYNQKIQGFPNSLIAKALGFEKQSFFQATTADVPQIPR